MNKDLKARVVPVAQLGDYERQRMYAVLERYYDGVNWATFTSDLDEKTDVILLESPELGICGFSTLLWKPMRVEGKKIIAVFSGDTVLDREYWGNPALGIRFLLYLAGMRVKHPFTPVYWMLISKGYKTYLMMANNFPTHYPDLARATPRFEKSIMDEFYAEKFGEAYAPECGIIAPPTEKACRLRDHVAPITAEMKSKYPRVAFFEGMNPGWQGGHELACLAKMDLRMPVSYVLKKVFFGFRRKGARAARPAAPAVALPAKSPGSSTGYDI